MNIRKSDVLNAIVQSGDISQRELAKVAGCSVGKVNSILKELYKEGYIDEQGHLLTKTIEMAEENRPKRAVILAAGFGMRMVPINVEEPKGLLEVHGETLVERLIRQLHEVGVREIYIVVGFMKEKYEYLIDEYEVKLIYNRDYGIKNNIHSLGCIKNQLENSYIIPCDIWCEKNPFSIREWYSWYLVREELSSKSTVKVNKKKELVLAREEEAGNVMIGISYIRKQDAKALQLKLEKYCGKQKYDQSFWETALFDTEEITVGAKFAKEGQIFEINTYEQLRELDGNSDNLQSDVIELLQEILQCDGMDIQNIKALKKGMTNRSFQFECRGKKYIMRIPGEGTEKLINRRQEAAVYRRLDGMDITDPLIYISPENGYKLTEFISDTRNCDANNPEDVQKCMKYLKAFHEKNIQVDHTFDLYGQIEYYEKLRKNEKSIYRDYDKTKQKVYELKEYVDGCPKTISLTHIDAVCDNFLMTDRSIRLIDWEYAGMQDVHVDIAMFAIYAMYEREQVEQLILAYFGEEPSIEIKTKIYCYIAICGFLWSNWCEYKRSCGVEFGEYSLRQYRYAKEYYKIAKEAMGKMEE